jgi:hypothetical protein
MRYMLGRPAEWANGESLGLLAQVPFKVHQLLAQAEAEMPSVQGEDRTKPIFMSRINGLLANN